MEFLYFTVTAIVLYVVSDRILEQIERRAGRRFDNRSLLFFAILLSLSIAGFALIRYLVSSD